MSSEGTPTLNGEPGAEIFSQGYRRYDGPRTGLNGAIKSLVKFSIRDVLGLGRSLWMKVTPTVTIALAYLPAITFVGLAAMLPKEGELASFLPGYSDYYGVVVAAIYIFAAFVAPLLLSPDRRSGMLGVYLASPLNRNTYLFGKATATLLLMSIVTLGPPLLMLIAYSLAGVGPDGIQEWITVFFRIVLSSFVIGAMYSAVALTIASMTDRWMVATAAIGLVIPTSAIISNLLISQGYPSWIHLFDIPTVPRQLIFRIHDRGSIGGLNSSTAIWSEREVSTTSLWVAWLAYIGFAGVFIWYRYKKLLVQR